MQGLVQWDAQSGAGTQIEYRGHLPGLGIPFELWRDPAGLAEDAAVEFQPTGLDIAPACAQILRKLLMHGRALVVGDTVRIRHVGSAEIDFALAVDLKPHGHDRVPGIERAFPPPDRRRPGNGTGRDRNQDQSAQDRGQERTHAGTPEYGPCIVVGKS